MPELAELPGIDEAMARLMDAEAAETSAPEPSIPEADPNPQQPVEPAKQGTETPASNPTGTPAAPETRPSTETPKPEPDNKAKSDFAKSQQRKDDSWKALNAEKDSFKRDQQTHREAVDLFRREQEQFKLERAKQTAKFTPEQYEQAGEQKITTAGTYDRHADGLEALADKLEAEGKYPESQKNKQDAKQYRDAAAFERGKAREMREYAAHMRQHPDPTVQQVQQRNAQQMRDYTLKAAEQWPDVAKDGSEFQKVMAGHLKEAAAQGMRAEDFPQLMYHAARLTAAETAAARVPGMDKELGELRAKVKELEALTSPGGGSAGAAKLPPKRALSDEEEGEYLRSMIVNSL